MRPLKQSLIRRWSRENLYIATCWKLVGKNNYTLGFTNHDQDILSDTILYKANTGFNPSSIETTSGLSIDKSEIEAVLDNSDLKEEDIYAGLFDNAKIEIFYIDWKKPELGKYILTSGFLGEITLKNNHFTAEVNSLGQKMEEVIGNVYSSTCRACFGDEKCKASLSPWIFEGKIEDIVNLHHIIDTQNKKPVGFFNYGTLRCLSGKNKHLETEIKDSTANGDIFLAFPFPHALEKGDIYKATAGCDKSFLQCKDRFKNVIHFRGEPHLPGERRINILLNK